MDVIGRLFMPPLPEAYSRVTNPERFRVLHTLALDLLRELRAEYDVTWNSDFDLLPGMTRFEHARPPVTLTPADPRAAPIAVAFTPFPSLLLRFGRWMAEPFPSCACDACGETAGSEGERFERILCDVVAGCFYEELLVPLFRPARLRWQLGSGAPGGHSSGGFSVIPRAHARALRIRGSGLVQWRPWPRLLDRSAAEQQLAGDGRLP